MKISKRQLKRIIKEEMHAVGMAPPAPAAPAIELAPAEVPAAVVAETETPEGQLVTEMESAISHLDAVMESLASAEDICQNCVQEVAAQAPVLAAVSAQADALKETLAAVEEIVVESTDATPAPAMAAVHPVASDLKVESILRKVARRLR